MLESGLSLPKSEVTVQEYGLEWLERRRLNGKPLGSWQSDEGRMRKYIIPEFGHLVMNRVSTKEWEAFLDNLVADELVAPATQNRIRSILTKMHNDGFVAKKLSIVIP